MMHGNIMERKSQASLAVCVSHASQVRSLALELPLLGTPAGMPPLYYSRGDPCSSMNAWPKAIRREESRKVTCIQRLHQKMIIMLGH